MHSPSIRPTLSSWKTICHWIEGESVTPGAIHPWSVMHRMAKQDDTQCANALVFMQIGDCVKCDNDDGSQVLLTVDRVASNKSYNDALIRVTKRTCNNQTETRSEQDMIVLSFSYH